MKSFFAWNMRGFKMTRKHRALRPWLQEEKSSFGCLLETRVQEGNLLDVLMRLCQIGTRLRTISIILWAESGFAGLMMWLLRNYI